MELGYSRENKIINPNENDATEVLVAAWTVETVDITARVASAIGVPPEPLTEMAEILAELRAVRQEVSQLRQSTTLLQEEVLRLRLDLTRRPVARIAPYAPNEGLVRLS